MKTINERGFAGYCDFKDTYGGRVRVYESSADPLDKVWVNIESQFPVTGPDLVSSLFYTEAGRQLVLLRPIELREMGLSEKNPKGLVPINQSACAHLSREQARALRDALDEFLKDQDAKDQQQ